MHLLTFPRRSWRAGARGTPDGTTDLPTNVIKKRESAKKEKHTVLTIDHLGDFDAHLGQPELVDLGFKVTHEPLENVQAKGFR